MIPRVLPRTLALGLGGTGTLALVELKKLLDPAGGRLVPPHVRLLSLDTVANDSRGPGALQDAEYVCLALRDPAAVLRNPGNARFKEWFPESLPVHALGAGAAAQIRALGRLALHAHAERLAHHLGACLDALTDRARLREMPAGTSIDEQGSIEVYLLASLCGGTGSGMFLDVAHLVREELRAAPNVHVYGVLLLPGPFRHSAATERVVPNAYAALKELDALGSLREPLEVHTGSTRTLRIDRSPFDLVYLVDSVGQGFDTTSSLAQLARQMAFLPYVMATSPIGTHVRARLHNLLPQLETKPLVQGKRAIYATFGLATLDLPGEAVQRAQQDFERELLGQLAASTGWAGDLSDLDLPEEVERCRAAYPPGLAMSLLLAEFGSRLGLIDRLEQIYHAATTLVDEAVKAAALPRVEALRAKTASRLEALRREAAAQPGRLPGAVAECRRLQGHLRRLREELRAEDGATREIEQRLQAHWSEVQRAVKSWRRTVREQAAEVWKEHVNNWVLPERWSHGITLILADSVGAILDGVEEVAGWCERARQSLGGAIDLLSLEPVPEVAAPTPFTRHLDAGRARPLADARAFLAWLGELDVVPWFAQSSAGMKASVRTFAQRELAAVFTHGGTGSASRILAAEAATLLPELRRFSAPMASYAEDRLPARHGREIQPIDVVGAEPLSPDSRTGLGDYPWLEVVETDRWDQVLYLQIRAGIPLFALSCMNDLWRQYAGLPDRKSRQGFHVDPAWAGWPELPAHAFSPVLVAALAHGLVSKRLSYSPGEGCQLADPPNGGRQLGPTLAQVYRLLEREAGLQASLGNGRPAAAHLRIPLDELTDLFRNDRVPVEDRPLVEALVRYLDALVHD